MILSYHPIFEGDENRICAGRQPDDEDLKIIRAADAVVLNQSCYESLYMMARENCKHIFPNYDAKFRSPGKIGQIRLFQDTNTPYPETEIYPSLEILGHSQEEQLQNLPFNFPFVFKFDWGGEGETVHLIQSRTDCINIINQAKAFEQSGHRSFLLQEYIPDQNRSLRVVVIGQEYISYWRVQKDPGVFYTNVVGGAEIDTESDPALQSTAISEVKKFCLQTKINLAGFDLLFDVKQRNAFLFLEINYYFGRRGLGGSEKYYAILTSEIKNWLRSLNL